MQLTRESCSTRWLVMTLAWVVAAGLSLWYVVAMRHYVAQLNAAGAHALPTPITGAVPTNYADAQTWVRYALAVDEGAPWQVRFTDIDNAPAGREVHWNSAFVHLLAAAGRVQRAVTGEPLPEATASALAWFNLPLLLACVVGFSAWTARRAGAGAGVLVVFGMVGVPAFNCGFSPYYVDHHGLLTAAAFGVVLGVVFMGGGWWRPAGKEEGLLPASPAAVRSAAIFSAVCGAVGMWISAASVIPAIAITGLTALAASAWLGGRARVDGATFLPEAWRLWGRVGAAGSFFFYLVEYAPSHLGWRLEANHPFYALAWWSGGELIADFAAWRANAQRPPLWQLGVEALAVALAPLAILIGGARVFSLIDPGLAHLHSQIGEFLPLWRLLILFKGQLYVFDTVASVLLIVLAGGVLIAGRRPDRFLIAGAALALAGFFALACWQVRWRLAAAGPQIGLVLVLLAYFMNGRAARLRWVAVLTVSAVCAVQAVNQVRLVEQLLATRSADPFDFAQILYRDVAGALRASQPSGEIVLLAGPNASTGIGYYGRFKTLGTLYWENYAGLKAASAIFSTESYDEARALMKTHGITHLALISDGNFFLEYLNLARPTAPAGAMEKTFGYQLLVNQQLPPWLRPVPYRVPPDVHIPNLRVLLLQVVPDQTEPQAQWSFAAAEIVSGNLASADNHFALAIAGAAQSDRQALCNAAGTLCYQNLARGLAIKYYRAAVAFGEAPAIASNLAWLLATSAEDGLRNPAEALAIAEGLMRAHPDDVSVLNTYAAALADYGRFPEAVAAAERSLVRARETGNTAFAAQLGPRIAAYRAGRPWRQ